MENKIRNITRQDFSVIRKWWETWGEPIPKLEDLPNNGLGGLILERDGILIAANFIYLTNSKSAYLSNLVADPKKPLRKNEQKILTDACLARAKQWGCTSIFLITKRDGLINRLKEYGFGFSKKEYANGFCRLL
jgi:N-acetylglutamate synthase-like GNAT family acetyltransferase